MYLLIALASPRPWPRSTNSSLRWYFETVGEGPLERGPVKERRTERKAGLKASSFVETTKVHRISSGYFFFFFFFFHSASFKLSARQISVKGVAKRVGTRARTTRSSSSFGRRFGSAISSCAKRGPKVGGGDQCWKRVGRARVTRASLLEDLGLETFVPHKLDISPEDVRYWTLLDIH